MEQFRIIGQPGYVEWLKQRLKDSQWLEMSQRDAEAANKAVASK